MDKLSAILIVVLMIAIIFASFYGWIANIIKLAEMDSRAHTGLFVARIFGIVVAPVGVIMGYVPNPDGG